MKDTINGTLNASRDTASSEKGCLALQLNIDLPLAVGTVANFRKQFSRRSGGCHRIQVVGHHLYTQVNDICWGLLLWIFFLFNIQSVMRIGNDVGYDSDPPR
jgi:hypothetical protein